jgi:hypothetical protein
MPTDLVSVGIALGELMGKALRGMVASLKTKKGVFCPVVILEFTALQSNKKATSLKD